MAEIALNRWNRALVTGASSGIGLAFSRLLADNGTGLVIVARDEARLNALAEELRGATSRRQAKLDGTGTVPGVSAGVEVEVLVADLADRDQLAKVVDRLRSAESPVDLLVNNAGFGNFGDFIDLDPLSETSVIDVNVSAMHRLAHAAGTAMSERGRGGILNVSSVAGFAPSPKAATYAATKAFVTSFSEALHAELGPLGVTVSCLCPGLTRTEFQDRADFSTEGIPDALWQSAEDVALAGLRGLAKGRAVVVPGAHNKAYRGALKATPSALVRRISKVVADRRPGGPASAE